jgi:hypothetical protein
MKRKKEQRMRRYLKSGLLAGIASVGLTAEAAYFVDIQQLGDDVVATGSGSINYQALTSEGASTVGGPRIQANEARLFLTPLAFSPVQLFSGISGPDNFGIGAVVTTNIFFSTNNAPVAINGSLGLLALPANYPSGAFLGLNTAVWDSVFFEDLDIVEGTYVWQWGTDETFDTFTIRIGSGISPPPPDTDPPTNNVPEPATVVLLGAALLGSRFFVRSPRNEKADLRS